MKICILALANPLFWVHHYVAAFRKVGEVICVGPPFGPRYMKTCGISELPPWAQPNDVEVDLLGADLKDLLPDAWEPDLIVGVSNFGIPLGPDMSAYDCPRVYLSVDAWQSSLDYVDGLNYDYSFVAQREFVPRMKAFGLREVEWLPLACDPVVHYPLAVEKTCDVSFVGSLSSVVHHARKQLLEGLKQDFRVEVHSALFGEALVERMCRGKLVFNHSAIFDLNMRIFEALGMGGCLLTNREAARNGLLDLFEEDRHLLVYDNAADLREKVGRYLQEDSKRAAIAQAGRALVLEKHCYTHRVAQILETIQGREGSLEAWQRQRRQDHSGFAAFLPRRLGDVIDFGLAFASEGQTLRKCGLDSYIGLGREGGAQSGLRDRIIHWDGASTPALRCDTLLLGDFTCFDLSLEAMLEAAHGLLRAGGTLVARMPRDSFAALQGREADLQRWMRSQGFHLTHVNVRSAVVWLRAQKRSCSLRSLIQESLEGFSFDAEMAWRQAAHFPADM